MAPLSARQTVQATPNWQSELLMPPGSEQGGHSTEEVRLSLVSAKEERDLQSLLDRFAFEVGDIEEFQLRLQAEHAALQAANVHAILESSSKVELVHGSLNDALALLEDVQENLATFDTKLLVMREDIAAIEAHNNRLELQTRNNGKLMEGLNDLLEKLQLPPQSERALKILHFNQGNLDDMVACGWELYDHLEALSETETVADGGPGISHALAQMRSVSDQRTRLAVLAKAYAERASQYIGQELMSVTDAALKDSSALHGAAKTATPDHSELRENIDSLASLLHVVRSLRPDVLDLLGVRYTRCMNMLLRKELKVYISALRKATFASLSQQSQGPFASGRFAKEEGKAAHSFTSYQSSLSTCLHLRAPAKSGSISPSQTSPSSRGGSPHSAAHQSLQPHEAYAKLLSQWVPLLLEELDCCAEFLMLKDADGEAMPDSQKAAANGASGAAVWAEASQVTPKSMAALDALLANISADFLTMVDVVSRQQQVQAVPMLAATLDWQTKLAGNPVAWPLRQLLTQCSEGLISKFERLIADTVASIARFEGRSSLSLGDGVKGVHVLPFVPNFFAMVSHIEELQQSAELVHRGFSSHPLDLAEGGQPRENGGDDFGEEEEEDLPMQAGSEAGDDLVREQSLQVGGAAGGGRGNASLAYGGRNIREQLQRGMGTAKWLQTKHGLGVKTRQRPREDILENDSPAGSSVGTPRLLTEAEVPNSMPEARLVNSSRDIVDAAYAVLARQIISKIEAVAARDAKHGERLRLENYLYFLDAVKAAAETNAVLAFFARLAETKRDNAIQVYVQQQLEYGKMWNLVEFSQGLDLLLRQVGPEEAILQPGYLPTDLRSVLSVSLQQCEKRLSGMHSRIIKHLTSNNNMVDLIWKHLAAVLGGSYGRIAEIAPSLYPSVQLPMSPDALRALLASLG